MADMADMADMLLAIDREVRTAPNRTTRPIAAPTTVRAAIGTNGTHHNDNPPPAHARATVFREHKPC